jgi:hypothetical protein
MIFLYPGRLWFLLLLLIPLIIHLFDFRKTIKAYFPHIKILEALAEKTKREQTLKRWLLFAIRFLAFGFLILAFCMPVRKSEITETTSGDKLLIAIDNSLSMRSFNGTFTLLQQAKDLAKEAVANQSASTIISIIPTSTSVKPDYHLKNECTHFIDSITYRPSQILNYKTFLNTLIESKAKSIIIFSDFQKTDFPLQFFQYLDSMESMVYLMPIQRSSITNISIDSIYLGAPVIVKNTQGTLYIKLKNWNNDIEEGVKIDLYINNKSVGSAISNLPPNTQTTQEISFPVIDGSYITGKVSIVDDGYDFDNSMFFAINIPSVIQVYHLASDEIRSFISFIFKGVSLFKYNKINIDELPLTANHQSTLYILESLKNISPDIFNHLLTQVERGNALLIIPPKENANYLNSLIANLGISFSDVMDKQQLRIENIAYYSPFFKGMFTSTPRDFDFPLVFKHYRLPISKGTNLLSLTNNDPFLKQINHGKGQIYIFASPLQSEYTTLIQHQLFVPIILQIAFSSAQALDPYYYINQETGIPVPFTLPARGDILESTDEAIFLLDLVKNEKYIPFISKAKQPILFLKNIISRADIYYLYYKDNKLPLAFNYPRHESDPRYWSKSELDSLIKNSNNIVIGKYPVAFGPSNLIIHTKKLPIWLIFVISSIILLISEIILLRLWKDRV